MSEKKEVDYVHENTILVETIKKERKYQKLYTEFSINPFRKLHIIPDKPMSRKPPEITEDSSFIEAYRRIHMEPSKKYPYPLTEGQEIGWTSTPLKPHDKDPVLNFRRVTTDVTRFANFAERGSNKTK